jgi:hypothetical protein
MRVRSLQPNLHPDFNEFVVHFTGRAGTRPNATDIEGLDDWERLRRIIASGTLNGYPMPGSQARAVCFTEATADGCCWLVASGRYTSCGLAFTKQFLFERGGGPVLQVRGDDWPEVPKWPERLRARAVRLWPGAESEDGIPLPWWLGGRSEWLYEREWRVPALDALHFRPEDIAFLVLPSVGRLHDWVREVAPQDAALAAALAKIRYLVIEAGKITVTNGVVARRSATQVRPTDLS